MRSLFLCLAFALLCQTPAMAHRVNVFAFVEGGEVVVECSYSKSKRVNKGQITVFDRDSGATLLQGTTDEEGLFRFPFPSRHASPGPACASCSWPGRGTRMNGSWTRASFRKQRHWRQPRRNRR